MAGEFFSSVAGVPTTRASLYVGASGPWLVDATLQSSEEPVAGRVTVQLGGRELVGTVRPTSNAEFALSRSLRVVGGAGRWFEPLEPQDYYVNQGIAPRDIAAAAARECGETLGAFDAPPLTVPHFVRRAAAGSSVLERLLGEGRDWWVDSLGVTQGGTRPTFELPAGSYQVDSYSSVNETAQLSLDDPGLLWVGAIIADRLPAPRVVTELEIHVEPGKCRAQVYLGELHDASTRIVRSLDALAARREARRAYGVYRYRVFVANDDAGTLNLQAVRPVSGLPDVLPVIMGGGLAGAVSHVRPGEIVGVSFYDGDPNEPFVAHYPKGDPDAALGFARMGELVLAGGAGATVMFSLGPVASGGGTTPVVVGTPPVPVVACGIPYACHFGFAALPSPVEDAAFLVAPLVAGNPLSGYVANGSTRGGIE